MKKYLALALALVMIFALCACGKTKGMTHDEYVAAALDTEVTIDTFVQDHQSWWEDQVTVYAQSKDGGYFIYNMACSEADAAKLVPGQEIIVKGYKSEWSGEVEITDATFEFGKGNYVATAADLSASFADADALLQHQNEFVAFKGLTVDSDPLYSWDGSGNPGDDLYVSVSKDGVSYSFTVESYLRGADTECYKTVEALKAGDTVDLEGFMYWYEGPQMHITSAAVA